MYVYAWSKKDNCGFLDPIWGLGFIENAKPVYIIYVFARTIDYYGIVLRIHVSCG